jgi:EAL domain-containing protein (putative c-di-GMP-specific phosphodiesterase class I)/ActR/RegA family two-component response regulator
MSRLATSRRSLAIVDDDPDFRAFVAVTARTCGYDTYATADAAAFERYVTARHADVAMLDLVLHQLDGIALMTRLSQHRVDTPLIIAAGIDDRVLQASRRLGAARGLRIVAAVHKPLHEGVLRALLTDAMQQEPLAPTALAAAFARDEFVLHYEPCVDLRTGRIIGVEALVRWHHPDLGLLPPSRFIALAEEHALIDPLTDLVFAKAIAQLAAWRRDGLSLRCSVNLSARSVGNTALLERVFALCRTHDVDPTHLTIEITETSGARDVSQLRDTVTLLRTHGCEVAIDDLAAGTAALTRLQQLPFTEIKLDRAFVAGMARSRECRDVVEATISMAHDFRLRVVAEGVENALLLHALAAQGCDLGQGYGISRPLEATRLPAFVAAMGGTISQHS